MKLLLDSDGKTIIGYEITGATPGAVPIEDDIVPENFMSDFSAGYYIYDGKSIVTNSEYKAPIGPADRASPTEQALAAMALQFAESKADQDKLNAQLLLATATQTVGGE